MARAAESGHFSIVELMMKFNIRDYNWAMKSAAFSGHTDILLLLLKEYKPTDVTAIIICSKNEEIRNILESYKQGKTKLC